jgi:hypothetical protein
MMGSEAFCRSVFVGRRDTCVGPPQLGHAFEMGIYAPRVQERVAWRHNGSMVGLFWAPLLKAGILNSGPTIPHQVRSDNYDTYFAAGGRGGLIRFFPSRGTHVHGNPPIVLGYIDYSVGRFGNLGLPQFPYLGTPTLPASIPWKLELIGTFELPKLHFLYAGARSTYGAGPDDLRIFVGLRIELGDFLRRNQHAHQDAATASTSAKPQSLSAINLVSQ